jgi:membrane-associated phospholipid phosphatase
MKRSLKQKYIFFCVEYLAMFQVLLLMVLALCIEGGVIEKVTVFVAGSLLLLVALLFAKLLKRLINRKRPERCVEFFKPKNVHAFPSGHTTGLIVLAFFMIGKSIPFGVLALCIACVVMIARIRVHLHDGIDILGGIILGVAVAYLATTYIELHVTQYLTTHMS